MSPPKLCKLLRMRLCAIGRELQEKGTIRVFETLPAWSVAHPHREETLAFQRAFREHIEYCSVCQTAGALGNQHED